MLGLNEEPWKYRFLGCSRVIWANDTIPVSQPRSRLYEVLLMRAVIMPTVISVSTVSNLCSQHSVAKFAFEAAPAHFEYPNPVSGSRAFRNTQLRSTKLNDRSPLFREYQ